MEDAIHKIHTQNSSRLSFEELYRNAYNMVLHRFGDRLYNGLTKTLTTHLERIADGVVSTQGEAFLNELKQKWEEHLKSTQMIRDILMVITYTSLIQFNLLLEFSTWIVPM